MTLVEIIVVVAILGIISGFAAVGLTQATRLGRVNGAATGLARILTTTRARAMSERCPHIVQINGPNYAPTNTGVLRKKSVALVFRKGNCNSTSLVFDPTATGANADRLVAEYPLDEYSIEVSVPVALLSTQRLTNKALAVGYGPVGRRSLAVDDGNGSFTTTAIAGPASFTIRSTPANDTTQPSRTLSIPEAGMATAQ